MNNSPEPEIKGIDEYSGLIWSIIHARAAYYFNHKNIDAYELRNDLYCEASMAYLEAKSSWIDDGTTKFSTWLHTKVTYKIRNYLARKINKILAEETYVVDGEVPEDISVDLIDDQKARSIIGLFNKAFESWGFKKCWYLYYIVAFDETLKYNQNLKEFIEAYQAEIKALGYKCDYNNVNDEIIYDFHRFSNKNRKSRNDTKLMNNIRNSIKYYLENNID